MLQREINRLFERLAAGGPQESPPAGEWILTIDVLERQGSLLIVAEVPGLDPESLDVFLLDHQVVISGERRERHPEPAEGAFVCMERPQGRFSRTIPLDVAVDPSRGAATLGRGLLTVRLPKLKDRRGRRRRIPVRREDS
jgi:HSP20 family protein